MESGAGSDRWLAELGALRQELADMRKEQRELARAVAELAQTFKSLAVHLGVAAEPYRKVGRSSEIPGFG